MIRRWHFGLVVLVLATVFPALASASHDEDEPIVLADGLELLYYMERGPADNFSTAKFTGEIQNTTDFWYDAPNLQVILYDEVDNILGSVSVEPVFVVIGPGETQPINGAFDQTDPTDFDHSELVLCDGWPLTNYVDDYRPDGLEIEEVKEVVKKENEFQADVTVRNNGDRQMNNVVVASNIYSAGGHYSGTMYGHAPAAIPAGKSARVVIDINVSLFSSSDPLAQVGKDWKYELVLGIDPYPRFTC